MKEDSLTPVQSFFIGTGLLIAWWFIFGKFDLNDWDWLAIPGYFLFIGMPIAGIAFLWGAYHDASTK